MNFLIYLLVSFLVICGWLFLFLLLFVVVEGVIQNGDSED